MSDQSSFWVSEKTKAWPYPSRPDSGSCTYACLASSGSWKNSATSLLTSWITSSSTPWLTSCDVNHLINSAQISQAPAVSVDSIIRVCLRVPERSPSSGMQNRGWRVPLPKTRGRATCRDRRLGGRRWRQQHPPRKPSPT
jgi:hypothetical protein